MRASHRLDLVAVPADADRDAVHGHRLLDRLRADGVLDPTDGAGPAAERWVVGGFARIRVDDPGIVVLYANRQGGFRVRCPQTGEPVIRAFEAAVTAWRSGEPRQLACPSCGRFHALDALDAEPPIAFGAWAVVTADAGSATLTPEAQGWLDEAVGATRVISVRG
ncbi:MAG: hypothetical protein ABMB14_40620 [Myxococcota bacterium]